MKRTSLLLMFTCLTVLLLLPAAAAAQQITVGSKDFTEQIIMGHMIAELLEGHGYKTNRILGLGGDDLVVSGMQRGEIDVWISYTGTLWTVILGNELEVGIDPVQLYRDTQVALKEELDLLLLEPIGFNNTYVFVVPQALANRHNLQKVSDLIPIAGQLSIGGSILFMGDRPDGIQGVERVYGMRFRRNRAIESGLLFQALQLGQVDVIVAFSTHGQIAALNLVTLEDDRNLFPPYDAGIVVRADLFERYPEVEGILNKLAGAIDDATMAALNYEVDGKRRDPRTVAREFLIERGLIN